MEHRHPVHDSDARFIINPTTRQIKNESSRKTTLVQNDHNSERFTFEVPKVVEGHDMSVCNVVEIHYLNISSDKKTQNSGVYVVGDLKVDGDKVTCSWLVSNNATQLVGSLHFMVRFKCVENGVITYAWNSAVCTGISISDGINADESFTVDYVDIIEQWKRTVTQEITDEVNAGVTEWKDRESAVVRGLALEESTKTNAALAVERARIDLMQSGATADDAELIDIRVGADGVTYESAGTAVRTQFHAANEKFAVFGEFETDTSDWEPVDVLEGYSWGEADRTYDDYGNIVSTEYTKNFTPLTELVQVVPGASYQAAGFVGQIRIYTAGKTQIDLLYNNAMSNQLSFVAPADACYFGIYYRHDIISTAEKVSAIKLFRTTMTAEEYGACPVVMVKGHIPGEAINDASVGVKKLADDAAEFIKPLFGKTIVNFGDSIFGNARPPEDISTHISALTGATVHNCGFGGCRMAYHPSANYDAFSMTKLADAITSGDFSLQDVAISNTAGDAVPGYFAESVALLKCIDFNKVDIITIAYGANDFNGVRLDNAETALDQRSFTGALRYSIETILKAYPHIRIFICSPTYRFWMDENCTFTEDTDTKKNGWGYTVIDLLGKVKEVAMEYNLPFIDNYHEVGINRFNRVQYFPLTDGAHHNPRGRKLIAAHIVKNLF